MTDNIFAFPETSSKLRAQLNKQYHDMAERRKSRELKLHGCSKNSNVRKCNKCMGLYNLEDTVMVKYKSSSTRAYRVCLSCAQKMGAGNS